MRIGAAAVELPVLGGVDKLAQDELGSPTIATSAGTCQPMRVGVASTWM